MTDARDVLDAEDRFFGALLAFDRSGLDTVLSADFLLIDVLTGSEIPRDILLDAVGTRQLVFESIERGVGRVRQHGDMAVVTGVTNMRGRYGEQSFAAHSRYTHVYVRVPGGWQLVTAQGTPIAPAAD